MQLLTLDQLTDQLVAAVQVRNRGAFINIANSITALVGPEWEFDAMTGAVSIFIGKN